MRGEQSPEAAAQRRRRVRCAHEHAAKVGRRNRDRLASCNDAQEPQPGLDGRPSATRISRALVSRALVSRAFVSRASVSRVCCASIDAHAVKLVVVERWRQERPLDRHLVHACEERVEMRAALTVDEHGGEIERVMPPRLEAQVSNGVKNLHRRR
eukprot:419713-Pleurochrysis_carterae.AAC.2